MLVSFMASISGLRIWHWHKLRHAILVWLWLWCRPAAAALIRSLAWAIKRKKKKSSHLRWSMIMWEKGMHVCMCDWVTLPCSSKLTEHCKPAIMEKKIKIIKKKKKRKPEGKAFWKSCFALFRFVEMTRKQDFCLGNIFTKKIDEN